MEIILRQGSDLIRKKYFENVYANSILAQMLNLSSILLPAAISPLTNRSHTCMLCTTSIGYLTHHLLRYNSRLIQKLNDSLSKIISEATPIVLLDGQMWLNVTGSHNETAELEERRRIENLRQRAVFCRLNDAGNMSRTEQLNMYLLQVLTIQKM